MGFVLYPYVYLAARAMFQTQSVALIETARGLGASQWRLARDIALPCSAAFNASSSSSASDATVAESHTGRGCHTGSSDTDATTFHGHTS